MLVVLKEQFKQNDNSTHLPNCMTSFILWKCCLQKTGLRNSMKYFRRFRRFYFNFYRLLKWCWRFTVLCFAKIKTKILFQSKLKFHVQCSANSEFKQKCRVFSMLNNVVYFYCLENIISTPIFTFQWRDKVIWDGNIMTEMSCLRELFL